MTTNAVEPRTTLSGARYRSRSVLDAGRVAFGVVGLIRDADPAVAAGVVVLDAIADEPAVGRVAFGVVYSTPSLTMPWNRLPSVSSSTPSAAWDFIELPSESSSTPSVRGP